MNYKIKTTVQSYRQDIPKQLFLTDNDRKDIKNKTVNLIFSTGRDITMRSLINVLDHIREIANFSEEQIINFQLEDNFKGTSQIEIIINCEG